LFLNNEYLTVGQAARLLGVSSSTIRRWIDQKKFSSLLTVGGHNRLLESEVSNFKNLNEKLSDERICGRNSNSSVIGD
jgi:excisionase family DNA binding protein